MSSKSTFDRLSDKIKNIFLDSDCKVKSQYTTSTSTPMSSIVNLNLTNRNRRTSQNKANSKFINSNRKDYFVSPIIHNKPKNKRVFVSLQKSHHTESACKIVNSGASAPTGKNSIKKIRIHNVCKAHQESIYERVHRYDNACVEPPKSAMSSPDNCISLKREKAGIIYSTLPNRFSTHVCISKNESLPTFKPVLLSKSSYKPRIKIESIIKQQISTPLNLTKEEINSLHGYTSYRHRETMRCKCRSSCNTSLTQINWFHKHGLMKSRECSLS